jgi:hypothetical protein
MGHSIRKSLEIISEGLFLPELRANLKLKNAPVLELGKYAKLKGVLTDPSSPLHALAGAVLRVSFPTAEFPAYPLSLSTAAERNSHLFAEIDCQWQIYVSLSRRDSLGLPLQPIQAAMHGQLVTLVQGCKAIAEGSIIGNHEGFLDVVMDDLGTKKRINVSASRSLVEISNVSSTTVAFILS